MAVLISRRLLQVILNGNLPRTPSTHTHTRLRLVQQTPAGAERFNHPVVHLMTKHVIFYGGIFANFSIL